VFGRNTCWRCSHWSHAAPRFAVDCRRCGASRWRRSMWFLAAAARTVFWASIWRSGAAPSSPTNTRDTH